MHPSNTLRTGAGEQNAKPDEQNSMGSDEIDQHKAHRKMESWGSSAVQPGMSELLREALSIDQYFRPAWAHFAFDLFRVDAGTMLLCDGQHKYIFTCS